MIKGGAINVRKFFVLQSYKLYFGDDSLHYLNEELPKYGKNVVLIYGGGSIKKTEFMMK